MSKRGRKPKKKGITKYLNTSLILLFLGFTLLFASIFTALSIKGQSRRKIPEVEKVVLKKLPPEIKKQKSFITPTATIRVPILLYHYVEYVKDKKDLTRQSLNINPDIFEKQIKTLKNAGYTFVTVKDIGNALDGTTQLPDKPVVITLDDGHWDLYTDVLPILKKYNAKATAYIIPGFLEGSDFLTIKQLQKVADSGLIEIGAHTVHHAWLKGGSLEFVEEEVKQSKIMLERLIKKPVVSFAYPSGAFDEQAIKAVRKTKFQTAVSTVPGIENSNANRYFLFRIRPGKRTDEELLKYLQQTTFTPW